MNRVHRLPLLVLIIIMAATALATWALAHGHSTAASVKAAAPYAIAVAVSPATHHVFALSRNGEGGASWVTMLDATSHRVLTTVSVPGGGQQIFADDATKHVLVISGTIPRTAPTITRITMLDAKTGKLVNHLSLKKGVVRWAEDKSQLKRIFVIVGPEISTRWFGAGSTLYALDTKSLKVVHTIPLRSKDQVARVIAPTGTLLIGNADGSVRFYDVLRTWKVTARAPRSLPNPSVIGSDDRSSAVGVINGPQGNILTILSTVSGAVLWERLYPHLTHIMSYALQDPVFRVLTAAGPLRDGVPIVNGLVSVQDPSTGDELAETSVGVNPVQALIDPASKHACVLSYDRMDAPAAGRAACW